MVMPCLYCIYIQYTINSHLKRSVINMNSTPILPQYVALSLLIISLSGSAFSDPPIFVVFGRVNTLSISNPLCGGVFVCVCVCVVGVRVCVCVCVCVCLCVCL